MSHNLLVLAAGYATRMGVLTEHRAKPLLEVAGRPMMDWLLDRLGAIPGLQRVVVVSNSKFYADFKDWELSYRRRGGAVGEIVVLENGSMCREEKLGAIGDLQFGMGGAGLWDSDLLVVGGDNLFELPPSGFVEFSRDKPAVIGTHDVGSAEEVRRFASIETGADGRIVAFEEKPLNPRGTIAGIALYSFQRGVLPLVGEYLAEGNNPDQAGHLIAWMRGRVATFGCRIDGRWFDVGSEESLAEAGRVFDLLGVCHCR